MKNAIIKITIHFVLFALFMAFGTMVSCFSILSASNDGEDDGLRNLSYFLIALLISLIVSFLAQEFIREGYSFIRVSLLVVLIFIVLGLGGYIYNYLEWHHFSSLLNLIKCE